MPKEGSIQLLVQAGVEEAGHVQGC